MKNKNKLILSALVMTFMGVSAMSYSDATTVIPYKDVNGVQSINIQDLVKSQGGSIIEDNHELYGKGYTYTINDKVVTVYENGPFIYVDGRLTPLKTEELVDSDTGEKFNFPVAQTPTKDGDGFLIPMTVIEKYTGIKGSDKGIEVEVKEEVKEEQKEEVNKEENSSSSNESSSNNNTSSNGGATNKPSNGNSGTTNGGSSNNGSNNSGSTNNGGSTTPQPETPSTPQQPETPSTPQEPEIPSTPQQPETPQEPETPQDNRVSFDTLASFLLSNGYTSTGYDRTYSYVDSSLGYMGTFAYSDTYASFSLENSSANFENVIKRAFNVILPTQGNTLFNIVSNPFNDQTLSMDGYSVEIKQFSSGVTVNIYK